MTARVLVHRNTYHDSVTLMLASSDAEAVDGVSFAAAVMGTPVNLQLLRDQRFEIEDEIGPNDMVVAVRADDDSGADRGVAAVTQRLVGGDGDGGADAGETTPKTIRSAARLDPTITVAVISVPGRFAAFESANAIEAGLHVFCFSDGMTLADEAVLKRRALDRDLLMMGADCGTAIIDGVSFGFANAVGRGPVGIVGASGTGIQQVTCLLDAAGVGISHAIGVGGRDLSAEVGGIMTIHALELLERDDSTDVIGLISKPPDPAVARRVTEAAETARKPVVVGFLGASGSLESTAARCAELCGARVELDDVSGPAAVTPGDIRGFFCGGSLCQEAGNVVRARVPGAEFVDFGDDEFTQGRPHPMIDPTLRNEALRRAIAEPAVGAVVVDVVLGYGAHSDPGAELASIFERAENVSAIVALCGAKGDPQGLDSQAKALRSAGAIVTRNAAHAGRLALAATEASQ
jgi:succinyl-CoA synthetase alpha subunit